MNKGIAGDRTSRVNDIKPIRKEEWRCFKQVCGDFGQVLAVADGCYTGIFWSMFAGCLLVVCCARRC